MATIELIIGSMFSGKSTELLRRCRTYLSIEKNVLVVNSSNDTRCDNVIKTHDNSSINAIKLKSLKDFEFDSSIDIIAIDEAQFFPDLLDFIKKIEDKNIIILIAGLDGDSNRNKFGQILDCIPYANTVTKLHAMCASCKNGTLASFSKRLNNTENQIMIGANDLYAAVCRNCYLKA